MIDSTDHIIASLADKLEPVAPARHPTMLFARWFAVALLYMAILLVFSGLRPDLLAKFHSGLFAAEVLLLLALIVTSGVSAVMLSFPDLYQRRWLVYLPIVPLLLLLLTLALAWQSNPNAPIPPHSYECLLCISLYSFVPAVILMVILRRQASVHSGWAGALALLASASVGCLALRLAEETDSIAHLVEWHYLPLTIFALLGVALGRALLKW